MMHLASALLLLLAASASALPTVSFTPTYPFDIMAREVASVKKVRSFLVMTDDRRGACCAGGAGAAHGGAVRHLRMPWLPLDHCEHTLMERFLLFPTKPPIEDPRI